MKLINESNWKQEIARLKAERIVSNKELRYFENLYEDQDTSDGLIIVGALLSYTHEHIKRLDKAIETIENVFVHKQCYIES